MAELRVASGSSLPVRAFRIARPLLLGSAALLLLGLATGAGLALATATRARSSCELPGGADALAGLAPRDRMFVARRLLLCSDVEHGRLAPDAYRARVDALDGAWAAVATPAPAPQPLVMQWASSVIDVSSQYTATSWSAREVLGPPNVYPTTGDDARAWASLGSDDRDEWIEVGYAQPTTIDAVELYETLNPGAVDRVELTTTLGHKIVVYTGAAAPSTVAKHRVDFACTSEPIASVRVHLDSAAVPGWNELDAIGVQPCH